MWQNVVTKVGHGAWAGETYLEEVSLEESLLEAALDALLLDSRLVEAVSLVDDSRLAVLTSLIGDSLLDLSGDRLPLFLSADTFVDCFSVDDTDQQ